LASAEHFEVCTQAADRATHPVHLDSSGHCGAPSIGRPALIDLDADPTCEPHEEVGRGQRRVEIVDQAVERDQCGGQHLVEAADEAHREIVFLVDRGQHGPERIGGLQVGDGAAHQCSSTRTWCS
jgi:hypothetical protein